MASVWLRFMRWEESKTCLVGWEGEWGVHTSDQDTIQVEQPETSLKRDYLIRKIIIALLFAKNP